MPPNVLLLTIDSLRADHAPPASDLMLNIEEFASGGVCFNRAYANGYSTPITFPAVLTGSYAEQFGGWRYMSDNRPFFADKLRNEGYETAGFHSNPLLRKELNYDVGFDRYNDFDDVAGRLSQLRFLITANLDNQSLLYRLLRRVYHLFRTTSGGADYAQAPTMNARALSWLDEERDDEEPFFLWNHYMDVHYPFYPPQEYLDPHLGPIPTRRAITVNDLMHGNDDRLTESDIEDLRNLYRGDVRYMDHHVGTLIEELRARHLLEDTFVIITSDHGELFGEHGVFGHPPSAYEENFRVPLVIVGPGIGEAVLVERPVDLLSLPRTIADLIDIKPASNWEGHSFRDVIASPGTAGNHVEEPILFGESRILAAQDRGFRLVWWREIENPVDPERTWELWDIEQNKTVSLESNDNIVSKLRSALEDHLKTVGETSESLPAPATDDAVEEQLDALGYK